MGGVVKYTKYDYSACVTYEECKSANLYINFAETFCVQNCHDNTEADHNDKSYYHSADFKCVTVCPDGYFLDSADNKCKHCSSIGEHFSMCISCKYGDEATPLLHCLECLNGYYAKVSGLDNLGCGSKTNCLAQSGFISRDEKFCVQTCTTEDVIVGRSTAVLAFSGTSCADYCERGSVVDDTDANNLICKACSDKINYC